MYNIKIRKDSSMEYTIRYIDDNYYIFCNFSFKTKEQTIEFIRDFIDNNYID